MIDFRTLVKAGVHFGHQTSRWMPKMDPYIWGVKNKVHLIDVSKTAHQLERSAQFLKDVARQGKQILWVGTKKPARSIIQSVAAKLDMPYVNHRWIGGTLSNFSQVKKSVTRLLHYEDVLDKSEKYPHYTKKELNEIQKNVERLKAVVGGIRKLNWPIGAIVIVDVNKEQSALREAVSVGVPVVGLVDTNSDPSLVDYVIPANDDAPRSIKILLDYLESAAQEGIKAKADEALKAQEKKEEKAAAQKKKAVDGVEVEVVEVVKEQPKAKSAAKSVAVAKKETKKEAKPAKAPAKAPEAAKKKEAAPAAKAPKKAVAKKPAAAKETSSAKQQKAK